MCDKGSFHGDPFPEKRNTVIDADERIIQSIDENPVIDADGEQAESARKDVRNYLKIFGQRPKISSIITA
jgi:hypothetical protein